MEKEWGNLRRIKQIIKIDKETVIEPSKEMASIRVSLSKIIVSNEIKKVRRVAVRGFRLKSW